MIQVQQTLPFLAAHGISMITHLQDILTTLLDPPTQQVKGQLWPITAAITGQSQRVQIRLWKSCQMNKEVFDFV